MKDGCIWIVPENLIMGKPGIGGKFEIDGIYPDSPRRHRHSCGLASGCCFPLAKEKKILLKNLLQRGPILRSSCPDPF